MSKKQQRGEREALGHGDGGEPGVAEREDLALLGPDVDLLDRLVVGAVGGREQRGGVLAPAVRVTARGEHRAVVVENRGAAQVGRHLVEEGERLFCLLRGRPDHVVGHVGQNTDP